MEDPIPQPTELPESSKSVKAVIPLTLLDDLIQNETDIKQMDIQQILSNFYKGAPPKLSYMSKEQSIFSVRRDAYKNIVKQIQKCKTQNPRVSCIDISHQPGSGCSTLTMQILWDLRKDFKCAIKMGNSAETPLIVEYIINLFKDYKTTVLLLVDNACDRDLEKTLNMEIAKRKINGTGPVTILLKTWRNITKKARHGVFLETKLSTEELRRFELKEAELKRTQGNEEVKLFHGFNLMRHNFSEEYVADLSSIKEAVEYVKENKMSFNAELFSILALLNSYVPGSFLSLSRCQDLIHPQNAIYEQRVDERVTILQDTPLVIPENGTACQVTTDTISKQLQFEKNMQPFMNLIVIFSRDDLNDKCVRLAHPMIAVECLKKLNRAGISKGEITEKFLESCQSNEPPFMVKLIKHMLIKRETLEENKQIFSSLILDMINEGDEERCEKLFEMATNKFDKDAFFPQAFARFLYIVHHQYEAAEHQARKAIDRDPENSFLMDTLGQVHKNHLRQLKKVKSHSQILEVADLALKAFSDEEYAAEKEQEPNTSETGSKKETESFNCRGVFGYIQVAKIIFDYLNALDHKWSDVLIRESPIQALENAKNILDYDHLIETLQYNVEIKHDFFESYLTYSKPSTSSEPLYFRRDVDVCYSKYLLRHSKRADNCRSITDRSFPGLFFCLNRGYCISFLERIAEYNKTKYEDEDSVIAALKYILTNIILSNRNETSQVLETLSHLRAIMERFVKQENIYQSPEFFLIVLLLFWPDEEQHHVHYNLDINNIVENMKTAFDQKYHKYFRCRYLRPLFFLGKDTGLQRLLHSWKVYNIYTTRNNRQGKTTWVNLKWEDKKIWGDSNIQKILLRVKGVFINQQLFAYAGDNVIKVHSEQCCIQGSVSFFLGFNIKGPVAYNIISEDDPFQDQSGLLPTCCECTDSKISWIFKDFVSWEQLRPQVWSEDGEISTDKSKKEEYYRITCPAGSYECTVTGLRWVCDGAVTLKYHLTDWEPYEEELKQMQYEPCGPLFDITIISGVLKEVHLPHFVCLGSGAHINDAVQALDVQDSGMILEPCELTRFHAKLYNPTFSPKGLLVKTGFPVKTHCEVLIYQMLRAHLTLHVYLVPSNSRMLQSIEKVEKDALRIRKPNPEGSLQMKCFYKLEIEPKNEDYPPLIQPEILKLRYKTVSPNYFEVYIKNTKDDFELHLKNEENECVWKRKIQADEYSQSSGSFAVCFCNKHMNKLPQMVSLVEPIADDLKSLIGNEKYSIINSQHTSQAKMRKLLSFLSGEQQMFILFQSLLKNETQLVLELLKEP